MDEHTRGTLTGLVCVYGEFEFEPQLVQASYRRYSDQESLLARAGRWQSLLVLT